MLNRNRISLQILRISFLYKVSIVEKTNDLNKLKKDPERILHSITEVEFGLMLQKHFFCASIIILFCNLCIFSLSLLPNSYSFHQHVFEFQCQSHKCLVNNKMSTLQ